MYSISYELSKKNGIYIQAYTATSNQLYICTIWKFWHSSGDKNSCSLVWKGLVDWYVGTGFSEDLAAQKMKKASPSKRQFLHINVHGFIFRKIGILKSYLSE